MLKDGLHILFMLCLPLWGLSQSLFEEVYGTSSDEESASFTRSLAGDFFLLGTTESDTSDYQDLILVKTDSAGNERWTRFYDGRGHETAFDIHLNKSLWLLSSTQNAPGKQYDIYLLKLNAQGDTIRTFTYGASGNNQHDIARHFTATTDTTLTLAGHTRSKGSGQWDFYLLQVDTAGNLLQDTTYGGAQSERLNQGTPTFDGGHLLVGKTKSFGAGNLTNQGRNWNGYLVRTDANQDTLWSRTLGDSLTEDECRAAVQTTDSGFYVLLERGDPQQALTLHLLRTDRQGNRMWERSVYRSRGDRGYDLTSTADSHLLITGYTQSSAKNSEALLVKVTQNGDTVWTHRYGGRKNELGTQVQQLKDSTLALLGQTEGFDTVNYDLYFSRLSPEGVPPCPAPVKFRMQDTAICESEALQFTNTSIGTGPFYWQFPDTTYKNKHYFTHAFDSAGSYPVMLSTCNDTARTTITVHPLPHLSFGTNKDSTSVLFYLNKENQPIGDIAWQFGDGTSDSTSTEPHHQYDSIEAYNVTVWARNKYGCTQLHGQRINLFSNSTDNIAEVNRKGGVKIWPHPVRENSQLKFSNPGQQRVILNVYNLQGERVLQKQGRDQSFTIKRADLPKGMYFFRLRGKQNLLYKGKLLVQ
jgi:hypothetical protein